MTYLRSIHFLALIILNLQLPQMQNIEKVKQRKIGHHVYLSSIITACVCHYNIDNIWTE